MSIPRPVLAVGLVLLAGVGAGAASAQGLPAVPTGLSDIPGNAVVGLGWGPVAGATSYHLSRSTVSGGPYTEVAAPQYSSDNDTSVTNGTTYYYVVAAVNAAGVSANSGQVSATPVGAVQTKAPSVPRGLFAKAGNAQVMLGWSASRSAT